MLSSEKVMVKSLPFMLVGMMVWSSIYEFIPHTGLAADLMVLTFGFYCLFIIWRAALYTPKQRDNRLIDSKIPPHEKLR